MAAPSYGVARTKDGILLPYIEAGGAPRFLAALPTPEGKLRAPLFSAFHAQIPRSSWEERDYSDWYAPVLDQGQHGSCTGHGTVTAFQRKWSMAGFTRRDFSACYIYGNVNGGRDEGATITDAVHSAQTHGVCLLATVPEGMIYRREFPRDADVEAANFKLGAIFTCSDFDDVGTAVMLGYTLSYSINVGSNFNNLSAEGVVPVTKGYGNHCVEGHGLVKLKSGQWGLRSQNSWTEGWGLKGTFVALEGHFAYQPGFEVYALQVTLSDPTDTTNRPPAQVA